MIPLHTHRVLIILFSVSFALVLADDVFRRVGLTGSVANLASGVFAGLVVFVLALRGGSLLLFCGKGLVQDSERRARVRRALLDLGILEERRRESRRDSHPVGVTGPPDRRIGERRSPGPVSKRLMYVTVVDSNRFIAITVCSGSTYRVFVSSRMVDALTHPALRGVLAHEYGHVDNRHPLKQAGLLGIVAAVKFGAGVPLGAALIVLFAYLYMLREWEFIADAAAVRHTCPGDILAAFDQYRQIEPGSDLSPFSELFCGHPSFARRITAIGGGS